MGRMLSPILRESMYTECVQGQVLAYWCPGCNHAHMVPTEKPNAKGCRWDWDGVAESPTITPSIHIHHEAWNDGERDHPAKSQCHHYVTSGHIQFLSDCEHHLAGQTVPMVEWPLGRRTLSEG